MRIIICEDDMFQRQFIQDEIIKYASFQLSSSAEFVYQYLVQKELLIIRAICR